MGISAESRAEKIQQVQYLWKELHSQSDVTETAKRYSFTLSPHRNYPDTFDFGRVTLHPLSFINFQSPSSVSSIIRQNRP